MERGKYWCFTLNNATATEQAWLKEVVDKDPTNFTYIGWGLETGDGGTVHFQGYLELKCKIRTKGFKKLLGLKRAHVETRKGTQSEASGYTCKEEGDFFQSGTLATVTQGSRTDLVQVKALIDGGATLEDVAAAHFGAFIRYRKSFEAYMDLRAEPPRDVKVFILWGEPGVGKTRWVFDRYPDIWISSDPTLQWFDGYSGESTVLLDDFRGECRGSFLLRLLDRYPLRVPVKGCFRQWRATRIYITSNEPAPWALATISAPLARRITKTVHFSGSLDFTDADAMARMDSMLE